MTMLTGPRDAEITILGGGAVGAGVAYFLARGGRKDIQLLEGRGLCEATSSQAAGFVGQARPTVERARLTMAAADVYRSFERETGYPMDYRECGAVRLALSDASVAELKQIADTAEITGLPVEFLTDAQLPEVYPVLSRTESVRAALWSPTCGYLQPNSLVTAYISAARDLGVTVATHAAVTDIGVRAGVIESVTTGTGTFRTQMVIIASGPWSAALARMAGLELPIVPVVHEYFVTEPLPGWHADLPCLRIPEVQVYARGESDRVLCGGFEHKGTSIDPREVTLASRLAARPDWDVLGGFAASLSEFAPEVALTGIATTFQGWPAFSPDGRFIVGPVSGVRGLVFAAACNAHGVSGSAGLAMHLLESLTSDPRSEERRVGTECSS